MHPELRPPLRKPRRTRKIRSMHGESWHLRRTVGTNVSREEHQLLCAVAAAQGVCLSAYLRAILNDVLAEECPRLGLKLEHQLQRA